MGSTRARLGVACFLALLWGCGRFSAATATDEGTRELPWTAATAAEISAPAPGQSHPSPYPPGKWRRSPAQLDHTLIWLSDIAIRHSDVQELQVSFHVAEWVSAALPVTRSRQEALALAERVVSLSRGGASFEQLAREFSDEPETAARGGSLGGVPAGALILWPQVLDAVEALKPGAVSNVVETETGYHVLYRRPPPPEASVSGRHIVIAHDFAPWGRVASRGPLPQRSREEALAIAARVYEQARARPAEFEQLVAETSEHRDAARGGDFGTWSTRELTAFPREIETLAGLRVGEIAEPIDSVFGIQIIQRVANPARERYAMTGIRLRFDPEVPDTDPHSKQVAAERAQSVSSSLRAHPELFGQIQQQFCCTQLVEVISGRELPALETALAQLQPGQFAPRPIEDFNLEYLIPKRVELSALPPPIEIRFDLPRR